MAASIGSEVGFVDGVGGVLTELLVVVAGLAVGSAARSNNSAGTRS